MGWLCPKLTNLSPCPRPLPHPRTMSPRQEIKKSRISFRIFPTACISHHIGGGVTEPIFCKQIAPTRIRSVQYIHILSTSMSRQQELRNIYGIYLISITLNPNTEQDIVHNQTSARYPFQHLLVDWAARNKSYWAILKIDFILCHSHHHFCHLLLQKKEKKEQEKPKLDISCPFLQKEKLLGALLIDNQQEVLHSGSTIG